MNPITRFSCWYWNRLQSRLPSFWNGFIGGVYGWIIACGGIWNALFGLFALMLFMWATMKVSHRQFVKELRSRPDEFLPLDIWKN